MAKATATATGSATATATDRITTAQAFVIYRQAEERHASINNGKRKIDAGGGVTMTRAAFIGDADGLAAMESAQVQAADTLEQCKDLNKVATSNDGAVYSATALANRIRSGFKSAKEFKLYTD